VSCPRWTPVLRRERVPDRDEFCCQDTARRDLC
jgi:hypothetical protein